MAMLRILDFSWHQPQVVELERPTIAELREVAFSTDVLRVVSEGTTRTSAVVLSDVLDWAVHHIGLAVSDRAVDVGLWDLLRRNQMQVHQDQAATLVATMAFESSTAVVHVFDDRGVVVGLFVPGSVMQRLPQVDLIRGALSPDVERALSSGRLPDAIAALEPHFDMIHSELLNLLTPTILRCHAKGEAHVVERCPCRQHKAPCG